MCLVQNNFHWNILVYLYIILLFSHPAIFKQIISLNPRPTKPFFCNMVYQGDGYHPPYELEIDGPKYVCLVPWYRVGSPLPIDTKIMKMYDVTMTLSNMAGL